MDGHCTVWTKLSTVEKLRFTAFQRHQKFSKRWNGNTFRDHVLIFFFEKKWNILQRKWNFWPSRPLGRARSDVVSRIKDWSGATKKSPPQAPIFFWTRFFGNFLSVSVALYWPRARLLIPPWYLAPQKRNCGKKLQKQFNPPFRKNNAKSNSFF